MTPVAILSMMKDKNVRMGKRITRHRERREWSKAQLARKAGVAPSYITRIEQGKFGRPSVDLIKAIADALNVRVADLTDPEPAAELADIHAALMAKGFRPDEAPLVDEILSDMVRQTGRQRTQVIAAIATLLAPPDPESDA